MTTIFLCDEDTTLNFGAQLAKHCPQPFTIYLIGTLGSGKTTLVRGFLRGAGYQSTVKSPTYTLVEPYQLPNKTIYHFDLYRLNNPQEIENIGIRDYFTPTSICLIEWPERAKNLLPPADLSCYIELHGKGRQLKITANNRQAELILEKLK